MNKTDLWKTKQGGGALSEMLGSEVKVICQEVPPRNMARVSINEADKIGQFCTSL